MNQIADRLKKLMELKGIEKVSELSYLLMLPEQTLRVWLKGDTTPQKSNRIWDKLKEHGV
jgi:hypothetical protein